MSATSKWLDWTPRKSQIIQTSPKEEHTKPTKPSFDGFEGPVSGESRIIQGTESGHPVENSPVEKSRDIPMENVSVEKSSHPAESTSAPGFPAKPCWCCHSRKFWVSAHSVVLCATCHPPANQRLVRQWIDLSDPATLKPPESSGEKLDDCPFSLPKGVTLVRYEKKGPKVALAVYSVVEDVPKFIRHALAELDARLHSPVQIKAGDSVFLLLSKLADCGLELRLEWEPDGNGPEICEARG